MPEITARDVLMRTKRLFTSGKWTMGTMCRGGDRYCLVGGLRHSAGSSPNLSPHDRDAYDAYWEAIELLCAATYPVYIATEEIDERSERKLIRFNDSRGVDAVVDLIDKAVERGAA